LAPEVDAEAAAGVEGGRGEILEELPPAEKATGAVGFLN